MRDLKSPKYRAWRTKVFKRDGYKCVKCGGTKKLEAHHLLSWDCNEEDRYNPSNGATLCTVSKTGDEGCHILFHILYGKGKNTLAQFNEFTKMKKDILKSKKFFEKKPVKVKPKKLNTEFDW